MTFDSIYLRAWFELLFHIFSTPSVFSSQVRNLLLGHRLASIAIRAASASLPQQPTIMMALNHIWFTTDTWYPFANIAVLYLNVIYNFCIPDALLKGRLPNFPVPFDLLARACGWGEDLNALKVYIHICFFFGLTPPFFYISLMSYNTHHKSRAQSFIYMSIYLYIGYSPNFPELLLPLRRVG